MKTINIKGKEYVPVVERVKEFHRNFRGDIITQITESGTRVIAKSTIYITHVIDEKAEVVELSRTYIFTGHSQAEWGKGLMGAVALEVAETSAIGRALGFANIGLIDSIASADEMNKSGGYKSFTPKESKNESKFFEDMQPSEEDIASYRDLLESSQTAKEARDNWKKIPPMVQVKLEPIKDELKLKLK